MWYISFNGEGKDGVNNILVYHDDGTPHTNPDLLPTGGSNPPLQELRGFQIVNDLLYVVNAYKDYSQILVYQNSGGKYVPCTQPILASKATVNSILHPFDLAFDPDGNCYVSSQDTNLVTGLDSTGHALSVAPYLQGMDSADTFLAGTFVASSIGALPNVPTPTPPSVPAPQGLSFTICSGKVSNSVRDVLFYNGYLYVVDEPGNAVKVYDGETGALYGQIAGGSLFAPVHLFLSENTKTLYVGSTGNDSVVSYDLEDGAPLGIVTPTLFIDGKASSPAGMALDAAGNFYVADRKDKKIARFLPDGTKSDFIADLPDEPEFILYVPKST